MADVEYTKFSQLGTAHTLVLVEQADGTFAERVALVGSATLDAGHSETISRGVSSAPVTSADLSVSAADVTGAPTSGETIVITDILVSADTAMRVTFTEETTGTVICYVRVAANGMAQITPRAKLILDTADKKLQAQSSASGNVEILVLYYSEA